MGTLSVQKIGEYMETNITLEGYISKVTREMTLMSLNKEVEDKLYLPQSAFSSCSHRAKSFNEPLKVRIDQIVSYAIIKHREGKHEEIHTEEKNNLVAVMVQEDVQTVDANVQGWWKT